MPPLSEWYRQSTGESWPFSCCVTERAPERLFSCGVGRPLLEERGVGIGSPDFSNSGRGVTAGVRGVRGVAFIIAILP